VTVASLALIACRAPYAQHQDMAGDSSINPERVLAHQPFPGVPNFGEVNKALYRGGQPSKGGFEALAKMGIAIVVDLRGSRKSERKQVTSLGMRYVPIPWHCFRVRDEIFARFLALLRANPGRKVFVHCRLGDDRTGMMIAAYRMAEQGWTAAEAKREMKEYGFTWFHHLICPGVSSYEESFPQRLKSSPAFQGLRPAGKHAGRSALAPFNSQLPCLLLPSL
jgi:protein tyrosine phosphatase (PTP) superfamily phosphohydrolase (DUF442 family)